MNRLPFLAVILLLASGFSGAGSPACAQEQMPGFNLPQTITENDIEDLSVDFNDAFDTIENTYLSDTIKLNYQISLLEKLVARQAAVQKISESYQTMGLTFPEPPPARGLCAQLPVNALCLRYYPELYSQLVAERKAYYDEIEARMQAAATPDNPFPDEDPKAAERRKKEAAERARKAAERERRSRYLWTDLTCLASQCHAVLTMSESPGYRATVRKGSRLADGTLVQNVSADGVRVLIDGDAVHVRPAPGDTALVTARTAADNPVAQALAEAGITAGGIDMGNSGAPAADTRSNPNTAAAKSAAASVLAGTEGGSSTPASAAGTQGNAAAPAGQTVSEPALGPSGLF